MKTLFSFFAAAAALFVASSTANAQITVTRVAQIPFSNHFSALRISGNYLYSTGNGFQVFDISNRTNPVNIATVALTARTVSVSGNYAYVIEGYYNGPLHIFDISTPAHPTEVGLVEPTGGFSFSCVSVFGRYAFLDAAIYDISNPTNPVAVGQLPGVSPAFCCTGNFVSASGHYAYVAGQGTLGGLVGLIVFDITDPTQPVEVAQASSGDQNSLDVALSGQYAFIAAPTNCGFAAFNISSPTNPVLVNCLLSYGDARVTISGNYAYLNYDIVDISNPTNLTRLAVPTYNYNDCIAVTGNYAYAAEHVYPDNTFLSVYRLDVPPPLLSITATGTNTLVLSWPAPTIAFALQQTQNLDGSNWVTLTNAPSVVASKNLVVIPTPVLNTFYRLAVSRQ